MLKLHSDEISQKLEKDPLNTKITPNSIKMFTALAYDCSAAIFQQRRATFSKDLIFPTISHMPHVISAPVSLTAIELPASVPPVQELAGLLLMGGFPSPLSWFLPKPQMAFESRTW